MDATVCRASTIIPICKHGMLLRNCSRIYVPSQSPPAMGITFLSWDNPITTVEEIVHQAG